MKQPIKVDYANVKIHLQKRILHAPLPAPRDLWTDVLNWCATQDTVPGRWSMVRGDELFQCGCNCCVPTEMVNSFSTMQSACWLVWFRFISLLLTPTELLVFTRLSFKCYMDTPASTLGKWLCSWISTYCLSYLVLFRRVPSQPAANH